MIHDVSYDNESVGPQGGVLNVVETEDEFELFFDKQIVNKIVTETNRYAEQFLRVRDPPVRSLSTAWKTMRERFMFYWVCLC